VSELATTTPVLVDRNTNALLVAHDQLAPGKRWLLRF
jgi:hypothetical protein